MPMNLDRFAAAWQLNETLLRGLCENIA